MTQEKVPVPNIYDYTLLAHFRGEAVLFYQEFSSYQGEWFMLTSKDEVLRIYKDYYGSCSYCDYLEGAFDGGGTTTQETVDDFIEAFPPFVEVPFEAMSNIIEDGVLASILPRNIDYCGDFADELDFSQHLSPIITAHISESK